MNWKMVAVLLKVIGWIKKIASRIYNFIGITERRKINLYHLIAYKYYEKVCVVRHISKRVRYVREEDQSELLSINQAISRKLQNLHLADELSVDRSKVREEFGEIARTALIELEKSFLELDQLGVGLGYSFSIDSSKVKGICKRIESSWYKFLEEVGKKIGKKVNDMEQDLWDKHNPL